MNNARIWKARAMIAAGYLSSVFSILLDIFISGFCYVKTGIRFKISRQFC